MDLRWVLDGNRKLKLYLFHISVENNNDNYIVKLYFTYAILFFNNLDLIHLLKI